MPSEVCTVARPRPNRRRLRPAALAALLAWAWSGAQAQTPAPPAAAAPEAPATALPEVDVTAPSPLLGSTLDRNKVPSAVNVVGSQEVVRTGIPSMLGALEQNVPGVSLHETSGSPFQPDLMYRGFTASPLDGANQGIAVYVNGARFNAPFSDTVNWDLIPSIAINRMNLEGANPVFGLNALGGSLSIQLKNGFTFHGADASVFGGSFGTVSGNLEYGREKDGTSTYVAVNLLHQQGWRQDSATDLRQFYGDIGWRGTAGEAHLSVLAAQNNLNQPGTLPVELLAAQRDALFTAPNALRNAFLQINGNGSYDISDNTTLQALIYYTNLSQRVVNGNTPNYQPCDAGNGFLCEQDGTTLLTDRTGAPIPDFLNGGPYSQLNLTGVDSNGYGASLQATDTRDLFGLSNQLVAGVSFDGGVTMFNGATQTGGLTDTRDFTAPGPIIEQADGSIVSARERIVNSYYGLYASDVLNFTHRLAFTLSGRFNVAQLGLHDQIGTGVSGIHTYTHFNPGVGLTYKLLPKVSAYVSYSTANRAPTPAELSCADINSPCTLANFFVGDPPLKQVVAQTLEAGLRGAAMPVAGGKVTWDIDLYRTTTQDDLFFASSAIPGRDFFQNIGRTLRQGVEATANFQFGRLHVLVGYALTDATFQSPLTLDSPLNPAADANGQIHVSPGDRMPGIPLQQGKIGFDMQVTPKWTIGARAILSSGQVLFGDESNLTPQTGAYAVFDANTSYQVTHNLQLFAVLENVLNAKYATYGTFSDVTSIPIVQVPNASNPRSLSPGAPISVYGGVRATF